MLPRQLDNDEDFLVADGCKPLTLETPSASVGNIDTPIGMFSVVTLLLYCIVCYTICLRLLSGSTYEYLLLL